MSVTLKLQPRRSPEPGHPFVNRGHELILIRDKVQDGLLGKQMRSVVLCFWGAFGMGKSWLLIELENRYRDGQQSSASHPTIAARLDLNREDSPAIWREEGEQVGRKPEVRLDRVKLIRELWRQFASQLGIEVPDMGWASADEWAKGFVREATTWATRMATPLILLDTVDDLVRFDDTSFLWLEQHLVEPLAMTDRVLFVFASRGELRRWKRFQVRRRVDSHRLTAFTPDATCQEVKANLAVGEVLHRHTFGHPLVTDLLGTALEKRGIDLGMASRSELPVEPALMRPILGEVVDEILQAVLERRVAGFSGQHGAEALAVGFQLELVAHFHEPAIFTHEQALQQLLVFLPCLAFDVLERQEDRRVLAPMGHAVVVRGDRQIAEEGTVILVAPLEEEPEHRHVQGLAEPARSRQQQHVAAVYHFLDQQ